jgi:hypothetical protein
MRTRRQLWDGATVSGSGLVIFVCMSETVGVPKEGPTVALGPDLKRLVAEGRISPPLRCGLPEPLRLKGDPRALSKALSEVRGQ